MIVMRPGELADPANPDVACTLALHLILRGRALHMTAHMRANDAVTGLARTCDDLLEAGIPPEHKDASTALSADWNVNMVTTET